MALNQYSQTPASNDLSGYFATGMAPSSVKTAGWDIMADLAMVFGLPTSGGSANAQTITNTRQYTALVAGLTRGSFLPGFTNTGAMTLQVDGLTAKNCFANGAAIIAGMVVSGVLCHYIYDGTNIIILNPQRSTGSFTLTLTGFTAGVTCTVNYAIGNDGKSCSIWNTQGSGTSNTTTMTGTGVPAAIQTITSKTIQCIVQDNSAAGGNSGNLITGASSGTWTFGSSPLGSTFTAAGTKRFGANMLYFTLD